MEFGESVKTVVAEIENVVSQLSHADAERFYSAVTGAKRVFVTGEGRSLFVVQTFAM